MRLYLSRPHRPQWAWFLSAMAVVYAVEYALLSASFDAVRMRWVGLAVLGDLAVVLPVLYWFLVLRPQRAAAIRVLPVVALGLLTISVLVPAETQLTQTLRLLLAPVELALVVWVALRLKRATAATSLTNDGAAEKIARAVQDLLPSTRLAELLSSELTIFYYALLSWRRGPEVPPGAYAFTSYRRNGQQALLCAFAVLGVVELLCVHIALHAYAPILTWVLTVLACFGLLWIVGNLRALILRPTFLAGDTLLLRYGLVWTLELPLPDLANTQTGVPMPARSAHAHLQMGRGTPNILLTLATPCTARGIYGRRRTVSTVALVLDEPAAFAEAIRRRRSS